MDWIRDDSCRDARVGKVYPIARLKSQQSSPNPQVEPHVESLVEPMEMVPNSVSKEMGDKWMKDLWDEI